MSYANNKGADQPGHPRSLISTFVVRCLDSMISLVSILAISWLDSLFSCADQFESYLVENPEDKVYILVLVLWDQRDYSEKLEINDWFRLIF